LTQKIKKKIEEKTKKFRVPIEAARGKVHGLRDSAEKGHNDMSSDR